MFFTHFLEQSVFNLCSMNTNKLIADRSFEFALSVIDLCNKLVVRKEFVLSKQLLRSGTSIGANVVEGSAGQSRKDFISKMSIASKEARETRYWLMLLSASKSTDIDFSPTLKEIDEIVKILTKIVKTSQQSAKT